MPQASAACSCVQFRLFLSCLRRFLNLADMLCTYASLKSSDRYKHLLKVVIVKQMKPKLNPMLRSVFLIGGQHWSSLSPQQTELCHSIANVLQLSVGSGNEWRQDVGRTDSQAMEGCFQGGQGLAKGPAILIKFGDDFHEGVVKDGQPLRFFKSGTDNAELRSAVHDLSSRRRTSTLAGASG